MIPTVHVVTISALVVVSLLMPIIGWYVVRRFTKVRASSFFVGMGVFFVCFIIAVATSVIGQQLIASPIILTLVLALRAGLVEEFGRFIAFKWLLKKKNAIGDSLMYGVGHGGIEVWLVFTLSMVSTLVLILMYNAGGLSALEALAPSQAEVIAQSMQQVAATNPFALSIGLFERITTMCVHISLSVIVFCAVRQRKWSYFLLAIALHTAVDASLVLYIGGYVGVLTIEAIVTGWAICLAVIAWRIARGYRSPVDEETALSGPPPLLVPAQPTGTSPKFTYNAAHNWGAQK
jgi:uncharacterized membrane protein YhfC